MNRGFKKPACLVPADMAGALSKLSKQALLDIAWDFASMGIDDTGTHESDKAVFARFVEQAEIVARHRGDKLPKELGSDR